MMRSICVSNIDVVTKARVAEILAELGFTAEDVAAMQEAGKVKA